MMDDSDGDGVGDTRRRGRPRGSKSLCAYIQNDVERRKYFVNRIKAIRAKAETFAKCTGEDILVIAIDENGGAHFWGTPAFERFMNMEGVQDLLYKHLTTPQNMNDPNVEAEHLRALLRQKIAVDSTPDGLLMPNFDISGPPQEWPAGIPWCEPGQLTHEQLLIVLKTMHQQQQAQAQSQLTPEQQHHLAEQQALEEHHMQHAHAMQQHAQHAMHHQNDYHTGESDTKRLKQ